MKRILIILGLVGWLSLPLFCHSVYLSMKTTLGNRTITLIEAGKATHQNLDSEPWFSAIKSLGGVAETYRSKYFLPFAGVWILIGAGLGAHLIRTGQASRKTNP